MATTIECNFATLLSIEGMVPVKSSILLDFTGHRHCPKGNHPDAGVNKALLSTTEEAMQHWLRPEDFDNITLTLDPYDKGAIAGTVSHGQHRVMNVIESEMKGLANPATVLYTKVSTNEIVVTLDSKKVYTITGRAYFFCKEGDEKLVEEIVSNAVNSDANQNLEMPLVCDNAIDAITVKKCHTNEVTHYERVDGSLQKKPQQPSKKLGDAKTAVKTKRIVKRSSQPPAEQHLFAKGKKTALNGGRKKKPKFRMGD